MEPLKFFSGASDESTHFADFVEENFAPAYRFAFCLSLAHESANRLTESVFGQARGAKANGADDAIDKQWLLAALRREWNGSDEAPIATSPETHGTIGAADVATLHPDVVLETLHGMRLERRLVLSLFYFERLSFLEIAGVLSLPAETVLARLADAKIELRQRLEMRRTQKSSALESPVGAAKGRSSG
ncbi:MAG: hypothetical protein H0W43_11985 [Chthoniobacterales bacterium]|nr:hypothetical protein [Chthoniobacterales bacterium]